MAEQTKNGLPAMVQTMRWFGPDDPVNVNLARSLGPEIWVKHIYELKDGLKYKFYRIEGDSTDASAQLDQPEGWKGDTIVWDEKQIEWFLHIYRKLWWNR